MPWRENSQHTIGTCETDDHMTDKPITLTKVQNQPVREVVDCLEDMLARVKRGEIQAISAAYLTTGDPGWRWHMDRDVPWDRVRLLHSVTHTMAHRMSLAIIDQAECVETDPEPEPDA